MCASSRMMGMRTSAAIVMTIAREHCIVETTVVAVAREDIRRFGRDRCSGCNGSNCQDRNGNKGSGYHDARIGTGVGNEDEKKRERERAKVNAFQRA